MIRPFIPPILIFLAKKIRLLVIPDYELKKVKIDLINSQLFRGEENFYDDLNLSNITVYAEIGCGRSSVFLSQNYNCHIKCVDTSKEWLELVRESLTEPNNVELVHVDLGNLKRWGRPESYVKAENIKTYANSIFVGEKPDFILIDGRFRVFCFLTSLLNSEQNTIIIFDDYNNRPHYHIVEEIIKPVERRDRQAKFVVGEFDRLAAIKLLDKFEYVMD